ncbi:hypothetical protein NHQ30_005492 [Ciborinia camelliae]|nr:hypothetical protein NHQ30_005492 [Ciborinia camelliae]
MNSDKSASAGTGGAGGMKEEGQGQREEQMQGEGLQGIKFPRVTIQFCTQCRWMLRAAYFAQELLSTFGTDIGEVALQPSTGGTFIVELFTNADSNTIDGVEGKVEKDVKVLKHTLWDRKTEGGFPETKELKKRLRNIIDPSRDLGHVDGKKSTTTATSTPPIPIPKVSALQSQPQSQPDSDSIAEKEKLNERGKIVVGGSGLGLEGEGGFGVCRPGDGECGGGGF